MTGRLIARSTDDDEGEAKSHSGPAQVAEGWQIMRALPDDPRGARCARWARCCQQRGLILNLHV